MSLSIHDLAFRSGVLASDLSQIELGKTPSAHVLERIAQPLGLQEEDMFTVAGFLMCGECEESYQ